MDPLALVLAIGIVAAVYASVGQAGGSGYLAVLALAGLPVADVKSTALALNVVVASVAAARFAAAGHTRLRGLWPLFVTSSPAAFVGGAWLPSAEVYAPLVGSVLLFSGGAVAYRAWRPATEASLAAPVLPHALVVLAVGAVLGGLAGATGTGGGVFLAPVILLWRWSTPKGTAALCALFVLLNSASALLGFALGGAETWRPLPEGMLWLFSSVALGGALGASAGATWLPARPMQAVMATVILLASMKMLGTLIA